jgi:hypothetical protein
MATQSGANLLAYPKAFPGSEAYGIDVAAPGLRYGHAKAEHEGMPVHFSQQNAEKTDFRGRLLRPDRLELLPARGAGGRDAAHPEGGLPAPRARRHPSVHGTAAAQGLRPISWNFTFDWDTRYNNEPFYAKYRSQDPTELCVEAGFPRERAFEIVVPDVTSFDMDRYPAFLRGECEAPPHGRGGWFIFGGRK